MIRCLRTIWFCSTVISSVATSDPKKKGKLFENKRVTSAILDDMKKKTEPLKYEKPLGRENSASAHQGASNRKREGYVCKRKNKNKRLLR